METQLASALEHRFYGGMFTEKIDWSYRDCLSLKTGMRSSTKSVSASRISFDSITVYLQVESAWK